MLLLVLFLVQKSSGAATSIADTATAMVSLFRARLVGGWSDRAVLCVISSIVEGCMGTFGWQSLTLLRRSRCRLPLPNLRQTRVSGPCRRSRVGKIFRYDPAPPLDSSDDTEHIPQANLRLVGCCDFG